MRVVRKMQKREGSFTVEAAILMPMILFLMTAVFYLIIYLHDQAVIRSYSARFGENILWQRELPEEVQDQVLLAGITGCTARVEENTLGAAVNRIFGIRRSEVQVTGNISMAVAGSRDFIGQRLQLDETVVTLRVNYVDDWLRTMCLKP